MLETGTWPASGDVQIIARDNHLRAACGVEGYLLDNKGVAARLKRSAQRRNGASFRSVGVL